MTQQPALGQRRERVGERGKPSEPSEVKLLSHGRLFVTPWTVAISPWNFPGKCAGVDCHFLLQGIFPTQGSNPGLQHCRQTLYCLNQGSQGAGINKGLIWETQGMCNLRDVTRMQKPHSVSGHPLHREKAGGGESRGLRMVPSDILLTGSLITCLEAGSGSI